MPPYWIDSCVFIDSANGPYTFARAPGYWLFIDKGLKEKSICTSEMVYRELVGFGDELSKWIKHRKQFGLCIPLDKAVQEQMTKVADHVATCGRYDASNISDFLSGADPWIIAHAITNGGTVVTNESRLQPNAKKVRIPDICAHFKVRCISGYQMLDECGAVI
jgi:rRNA-processing protein FCF1